MRIEPLDPVIVDRFREDLNALVAADASIGVAVSGGPDSVALLLLTNAVHSEVQAATVDHGLRSDNAREARDVADLCRHLGVSHRTLQITVPLGASVQAKARDARYTALTRWAGDRHLDVILTAHHADDQAETVLMRLARGSGVSGLAGIRPTRALSSQVRVARPLLGWRKSDLAEIARRAGVTVADDPSNHDPTYDRTHLRDLLAQTPLFDPHRLSASAAHARDSEEALDWSVKRLAAERVRETEDTLHLMLGDLPIELQRRLLVKAMLRLASAPPRGADLDRLLSALRQGRAATLGGLKFVGGETWRVSRAPPRSRQLAASGSRSGSEGTKVDATGASVVNGARKRPVKPS